MINVQINPTIKTYSYECNWQIHFNWKVVFIQRHDFSRVTVWFCHFIHPSLSVSARNQHAATEQTAHASHVILHKHVFQCWCRRCGAVLFQENRSPGWDNTGRCGAGEESLIGEKRIRLQTIWFPLSAFRYVSLSWVHPQRLYCTRPFLHVTTWDTCTATSSYMGLYRKKR